MGKVTLGCCVFTVQDAFNKAPYDTLYKLADMGYESTEIGDFSIIGVSDWKAALKRTGLTMDCLHFSIEFQESWSSVCMEIASALGVRYIGYPMLRGGKRDAEQFKYEAGVLNRLGAIYRDNGFQMIYHNHDVEFTMCDGVYGLDILRENTDPDLVWFELDTHWISRGGADPADTIRRFGSRAAIIHCKDKTEDDFFAPVGEGVLDFPGIVKAALESGVKRFIVEQDAHRKPSLECARVSYAAMSKLLGK